MHEQAARGVLETQHAVATRWLLPPPIGEGRSVVIITSCGLMSRWKVPYSLCFLDREDGDDVGGWLLRAARGSAYVHVWHGVRIENPFRV